MKTNETRVWLICFASIAVSMTLLLGCTNSKNLPKIPTASEARARVLKNDNSNNSSVKEPLRDPLLEEQYSFLKGGKIAGVKRGQLICIVESNKGKKDAKKVSDTTTTKASESVSDKCDKKVEWGSVLLSPKKAGELATVEVQRNLLIEKLQEERIRRRAAKIIYNAALAQAEAKAKRTWWEKNKGIVSGSVFFAVGVAATVGLVYALSGGAGAN